MQPIGKGRVQTRLRRFVRHDTDPMIGGGGQGGRTGPRREGGKPPGGRVVPRCGHGHRTQRFVRIGGGREPAEAHAMPGAVDFHSPRLGRVGKRVKHILRDKADSNTISCG